jgi:hypothetical protein
MSALTQVTGIVTVSAGGTTDIQPAEGENWVITSVQFSALAARVKLIEGALVTNAIYYNQQLNDKRIFINNTCYMRLYNGTASDIDAYYCGYKLPSGMTVVSTVQRVAASSDYDFQPDAGKVRLISEVYENGNCYLRLVKTGVTEGIIRSDFTSGQHPRIYCSNSVYARVTNTYASGARTVALSAVDITGGVTIASNCYEVINGATQSVQPAAGETWVVYEWGWSDDDATITAQVYDGTDTVALTQTDLGVIRGGYDYVLTIDNDRYLRFPNACGSTRYLCISAVKVP